MKLDILIKNGHVIDTKENVDSIKNIGVIGNKVVDVDAQTDEAGYVIDADGCYVFPGLIDFHAHVYYKGSEYGINPDWMLPTGVTSTVDAGTCGYANYEAFNETVRMKSDVRIKSFINMSCAGIYEYGIHPNYNPTLFKEKRLHQIKEKYGDDILGLKIMFSDDIIGEYGMKPLLETIKIAERIGNMAVCVHTTDPASDSFEIAKVLRPGDIYCHCYSGKNKSIIDTNGKVYEDVKRAKERGVIFDAANGRMHFSFNVAEKAIDDNFLPDVISTDAVTQATNVWNYNRNLPFVMSKYLNMGLSLNTVVKCVTETPAKLMKMEGKIGTLKYGAFADVSIFKLESKKVIFDDIAQSGKLEGNMLLMPKMTIADGRVVYCETDFNLQN